MNEKQYDNELNKYRKEILASNAFKKLIVAGPGTGKSSFFEKAIKHYGGTSKDYLVLTFINSLKDELKKDLEDIAKVFTFHGYCYSLLLKYPDLRIGLKHKFHYYPPLIGLVKSDWSIMNKEDAPKFGKLMRNTSGAKELDFFIARGNYYNTIGYDDSVFRVYRTLKDGRNFQDKYKLIIVDEYQDFNALETSVLSHIIDFSPSLIVGDDDQALYCQLRDSKPDFIRELHQGDDFQNFELPFCLRCPKAVISSFDSIIKISQSKGILSEKRIPKKFIFFPPVKGKDSEIYPRIKLIISSIQKKFPLGANYFGRYVSQEIANIPRHEIEESREKNFPTVLIIGPNYYLKTLIPIFDNNSYDYEFKQTEQGIKIDLKDGFKLLNKDESSNLGWRIILEVLKPDFYKETILISITKNIDFVNIIPNGFKQKILAEAKLHKEGGAEIVENEPEIDKSKPTIKLTTFEGAKGLSAQRVFILGLQDGDLPRNPNLISDIEVCKLLVAITRTRKQCYLLSTRNFAGKWVTPSEFLSWVNEKDIDLIEIDKHYDWGIK